MLDSSVAEAAAAELDSRISGVRPGRGDGLVRAELEGVAERLEAMGRTFEAHAAGAERAGVARSALVKLRQDAAAAGAGAAAVRALVALRWGRP